jgi:hypothetical protein
LVLDLELFPLVLDFVDKDFELNSGTVLRFNELVDYSVELAGSFV